MVKVTLRERDSKHGKIYLYLDYYPAFFNPITMKSIRHEYLGIHLYADPKNAIERNFNASMRERAEAIRTTRALQIVNEEYGFLDKQKLEYDFISYLEKIAKRKHIKWEAATIHFKRFMQNKECRFKYLTVSLCEKFKEYLLTEARSRRGGRLSNNTAAAYYCLFRSALKQAYVDGILDTNLNERLTEIKTEKVHKDFLTIEEVRRLNDTECEDDNVKRASMFSIFTGLRMSDIITLQWHQIQRAQDGGYCIKKTIVKTGRDEVIFISKEALSFCGKQSIGRVFPNLSRNQIYEVLPGWIRDAGITKHITFHCFRHTYATLMIAAGVDIYTVSKMLTHQNVATTQIYADVVDEKKRAASNVISLKDTGSY